MNVVFLLLGSNLSDRLAMLESARSAIAVRIGKIIRESAIYESEPWGFNSEQQFLNQVIKIETRMNPSDILKEIFRIETELGRKRGENDQYTSRTIDIDILFFNNEIIREEKLTIPHPKIQERMFTLIPLSEIDGRMIHPESGKSIGKLVAECTDPLKVHPYHP